MMHAIRLGAAVVAVGALSGWSAQAAAGTGIFMHMDAIDPGVQTEVDTGTSSGIRTSMLTPDKSDTAYRFFGGYQFNAYLGGEVGYVDFGKPELRFNLGEAGTVRSEADVTGWAGHLIGQVPIGHFDLLAKLGLISYDATVDLRQSGVGRLDSQNTAGEEFSWGVGAAFNIGNFSLRGEYEMYDIANDVEVWSLSGVVHF